MQDTPINKFSTLIIDPEDGADDSLNPIIFLHGLTGSKELWHDIPQIVCNQTKRKGYAYDARNHGDSEWRKQFNFISITDDLCHFMVINDIPRAILIGHSMGGWAATRMAMKFPEKVELVILEDVVFGKIPKHFIDATIGYLQLWMAAVRKIPPNTPKYEAIKFAVDYFYHMIPQEKQSNFSPKEILYKCNFNFHQTFDGRYDVKINTDSVLKSLKHWDSMTCHPEGIYDGPACFIYGDLSMFKIKSDAEIRKHFPNSEVEFVEKASHNVHMDQAKKCTDIILNFIHKHHDRK